MVGLDAGVAFRARLHVVDKADALATKPALGRRVVANSLRAIGAPGLRERHELHRRAQRVANGAGEKAARNDPLAPHGAVRVRPCTGHLPDGGFTFGGAPRWLLVSHGDVCAAEGFCCCRLSYQYRGQAEIAVRSCLAGARGGGLACHHRPNYGRHTRPGPR